MTMKAQIHHYPPPQHSQVLIWPDENEPSECFRVAIAADGTARLSIRSASVKTSLDIVRVDHRTALIGFK